MSELMEVIIKGTASGEMYINRLNFVASQAGITDSTSYFLLQCLGYQGITTAPVAGSVLDELLTVNSGTFQATELVARNIYNVTDFITLPVGPTNWVGLNSGGSYMPNFSVQKLRSNLRRQDIGRGFLTLDRPKEADVDDSGSLGATPLGKLAALAAALEAVPSFTDDGENIAWSTCVVGKEKYRTNPDSTKDPTYAYRYYEEKDEQFEHIANAVSWAAMPKVRSQVSRQYGKGR